ncbi:four helix bundle protein [Snuella sedimenti]|uniref:Four helix bundle protein n=1 Tax=Snuella sedimenti TaxID=2798802 RepID=A0A8J7J696_9FLAO|nr:four helix bundle protein [Snuella sedimenti]MBJ6369728.1 four helix bundle protein [Snuella sedimenti]
MENTKTFRKLLIWQKSMVFVTKIYSETKLFPNYELYALTSQIKRSSISHSNQFY